MTLEATVSLVKRNRGGLNSRYDGARVVNIASGVHPDALPESEAIACENAEELSGKQNSVNERLLGANLPRLI